MSYILENYPVFEVKMRNTNERKHDSELYMPLQMRLADKLCADDKSSSYFSENNSDFLNETGVIKNFQYNDEFLRPHLVSNCYYDIMFGSQDAVGEPLNDTFKDISVYGIIAQLVQSGKWGK